MSTDGVDFGNYEVTVRMLMVIIELRNSDTVKDTVTDGDCNSFIGVGEQAFLCHELPKK